MKKQVWDRDSKKICPRCQKEYTGYPALSRADNHTYICSDCGLDEAMQGLVRPPVVDYDSDRVEPGKN